MALIKFNNIFRQRKRFGRVSTRYIQGLKKYSQYACALLYLVHASTLVYALRARETAE